ncbi:MAG: beta-propeller fold lactonase family protein [Deltaproteobacteria bacterium]|nr:beta-propeller fold lactonase family protein [Deltaproteobacteria bacterium]
MRCPCFGPVAALVLAWTACLPWTLDAAEQSSPIALTADDHRLVNVNPDANTVTVFDVTSDSPVKLKEIKTGKDPENVAISPDDRAYVANALDGTVTIIDVAKLKTKGKLKVGVEPRAVALSPNGTRLYVANAVSNNLMVFDTTTRKPTLIATADLSLFGTSPRALAVTNDGDTDDTDESVFVASFFAQLRPGKTSTDEGQDDQREGRVVAFSAATNTLLGAPNPITLAPLANTGFNANGRLAPAPSGLVPAVASTNPQTFTTATGAFPNQLAAIAIHPSQPQVYVVSTGASPNGPLRFNSNIQGLVSIFDRTTRNELTAAQTDPNARRTAPLNLNQGVNLATTPAPRLFFSNPVAVTWRPDGSDAWIAIQSTDTLVRLTADAFGVPTIGAPLVAGPSQIVRVDLRGADDFAFPRAPRGLVINGTGQRAYVSNFISRSVSVVDLSNATAPAILAEVQSSAFPENGTPADLAQVGAALFYTGRGPQTRMSSEGWGSCVTCHPGGLSDNVTWMFDTGPRQTIALDGTFNKKKPFDQHVLNWSAIRDEVQDFELNTRNVFGGRGLIDDDRLFYALGGASGASPTDSALIEQFQQVTGAVGATNDLAGGALLPQIIGARRDFGVATLNNDRVFIIGGRTGPGQGALITGAASIVEFNPRTNAWTPRNNTGFTGRHSLGAAAVETAQGERVYAIGGYASTDASAAPLATVEEYNPQTDTWRTVSSLPTGVAQFGVTVAGGVSTAEPLELIHVVAGSTGSEAVPTLTTLTPVQRFQADPAGPGTWTSFNPAGLTLRRNHGVATVFRGVTSRVFVIGGQNDAGTVLGSVEEYLAQAAVVVATPHTALPAPRARFGIGSSLSTNQIYVLGGVDNAGADQTSIFEYSPATNGPVAGPAGTPSGAWVTRGNLSLARRDLRASTPPGVTNFLPVASGGRSAPQDVIATFVETIRSLHAPVAKNDVAAKRGKKLFKEVGLVVPEFSCASCHGGKRWSRSTVDYPVPPSPEIGLGFGAERVIGAELRQTLRQGPDVLINVGTFTSAAGRTNEIRINAADPSQAIAPLGANGLNIPSLLSVHATAPYFYSGLSQTLEQVLDGSQDGNGGTRHHFVADSQQRADLVQFLRSIDQTTPTFK